MIEHPLELFRVKPADDGLGATRRTVAEQQSGLTMLRTGSEGIDDNGARSTTRAPIEKAVPIFSAMKKKVV
jgi:hypothetical protein